MPAGPGAAPRPLLLPACLPPPQLPPPCPLPQARALAEAVVQHGGGAAVQAEALTIAGRACHAEGEVNEAYRYYQQVQPLGRASAACDFQLLP